MKQRLVIYQNKVWEVLEEKRGDNILLRRTLTTMGRWAHTYAMKWDVHNISDKPISKLINMYEK